MSSTGSGAAQGQLFSPRMLFVWISASLLAAAGFFLLATYAPDFRLGTGGGETPLSKSGVGFAGLAEFMALTGDAPKMARSANDVLEAGPLIVTIAPESSKKALAELVETRMYNSTLYVLPKWQTVPLLEHPGWVEQRGRLPASLVNDLLHTIIKTVDLGSGSTASQEIKIGDKTIAAPEDLQWIKSAQSLISAADDRAVLIHDEDQSIFVLADPDLLNNAALKDGRKADAALALLDVIGVNLETATFDLTLHGFGQEYDLAKLITEPPFLALTLTILAASALAMLHGLGRFGPVQSETRAIPFGKRALVETTTTLLRRAGRLDLLGEHYAALMRSRVAAQLGAPSGMQGNALDQWLETRDRRDVLGLSARLGAMRSTTNQLDMQSAARDLHDWIARRASGRK